MDRRLARPSAIEYAILSLLAQDRELFGLQIVERSEGAVKRGTVYVTLGAHADQGLSQSRTEAAVPGAIGLPRRLYRLTPYGRATIKAWNGAERTFARLHPVEA